jgi:hypothetical protein
MIDKDKQYKTRDGREVRIYATDGGGEYPVHGAIRRGDGWGCEMWGSNGRIVSSCRQKPEDLIEVKPRMKFERWYLFTSQGDYSIWQSKPDTSSAIDAFAIKHIVFEVEEGEGLDAV